MKPTNLVVIMADEHNAEMFGFRGRSIVQTPNIDALARSGTVFDNVYTPSPLCVPARSAFATGREVDRIGAWCNATAYTGEPESWHRRLREAGHHSRSIGKLHFRGAEGDDNGFSVSEVPMNIVGGVGDALGLIRSRTVTRGAADKMARLAGPGNSRYLDYDREISARSQIWLREEAPGMTEKPWVLFVSFVSPHFPLTAPPEHYYRYRFEDIQMPKLYDEARRPRHPYLEDYRSTFAYHEHFRTQDDVKRAIAGYMGLCSFIDEQVGHIVRSIEEAGLMDNTRIVYTSDHGDNLGTRGLWGKSNMYEESVKIPLIVSGPDIPAGETRHECRSLIDLSRFVLDSAGCDSSGFGNVDLFSSGDPPVISQYHGTGSRSGAFMLRTGRWKYVEYALYEPQLFDLEADPEELNDLGADRQYDQIVQACATMLRERIDPLDAHEAALRDQRQRIDELGGEQAIIDRGDYGFSPPPGVKATFS